MKKGFKAILLCCLLFISFASFSQPVKVNVVKSSDKTTACEIGIDKDGRLIYRILYESKPVINWSPLGLVVNNVALGEKTVLNKTLKRSYNEKFAWRLGEDDVITNQCNEVTLSFHSASNPFDVIARVFDGSVAFRYVIPAKASSFDYSISKENTALNFASPVTVYQYNQESAFTPTAIDTFSKTSDLPTTAISRRLYFSIGEADNVNYTKAELKKGNEANSIAVAFIKDSVVRCKGNYSTPWRTVSISKNAIGLHKFSQLYLKLNPPSQQGVPAWIKPGKLIRAQLNTQAGLDCIDFAATHNLQYIMFDAGWYGAEFRGTSDPTTVIPDIDMPKVIAYGKQKGIGVILYVNYVGLRAKLDTILPLYKKWGVAGLKFGFVNGLTQDGLTWLSNAIKKVNDYGFILDIHDNYKPTGLSRTYPALLTQEGIRGDENSPDAFHTTVLPFTRFLAGPADFTFCYPNPKNSFSKNLKVSKGQQLALTVIYFSPLQSMFWYGKPLDYTNESEIEFFKYVPTVWNESHYLAGDIGKNISVARRKGNTWFVGNAAGTVDWKTNITLNFLAKGKSYTATVYEDDGQGSIRKRVLQVTSETSLPIDIKSKEGQAIMIELAQ
jgi:alpha-glucosidase